MAVIDTTGISTGPGVIYWAPVGSTEPTHTVTAGLFSDTISSPWVAIGATRDGSQFTYQINTDNIEVAESLDVVRVVTTSRTGSYEFDMANVAPSKFKIAFNGGTVATTGTTTTTMTSYTPPAIGAEVRSMLLWQSDALDERLVLYQMFNNSQVQVQRRKGANYASIPCNFQCEVQPSTGLVWKYVAAGTVRV